MYSLMRDYEGPCMMIIKDADEQVIMTYSKYSHELLKDTILTQILLYLFLFK